MGNMSNPTINRWGLNLFWYRFWHYDKNYYLGIQHDDLITQLVYAFLNFGILFPLNIFINKYWYLGYKFTNYFNNHNTKYYRIMSSKNTISNEISYYKERIKIENIYQSKIWILKFHHWIVINFYCFNPIKKRQNTGISYKKRSADIYLTKFPYKVENIRRLKLIYWHLIMKNHNTQNYYYF